MYAASGKEPYMFISHNESEGIEPRNMLSCIGPRVSPSGSQYCCTRYGEGVSGVPGSMAMAGHSRFTTELGRAMSFSNEASNKLKKQGGGMAAWQSDWLIVEA